MRILAIETSCDETAAAILEPPRRVLASVLHSQVAIHRPYGGIVPELASRSHIERIDGIVAATLAEAGVELAGIDAVASTRGPGLLGALLVGNTYAQTLAWVRELPWVGVNHLHGHLLSPDLDAPMQLPALVLLVTGGHTALYLAESEDRFLLVRRTVDDAVGEAFDKVAKLLGLGYPGGPEIERVAAGGDPEAFAFPRPCPKDPRALSFSGLKTAVRRAIEAAGTPSATLAADVAASFQAAVRDVLAMALEAALAAHPVQHVYLVGGVARNATIRTALAATAAAHGAAFAAPAPRWCTDNAAMIARAGWVRLRAGERDPWDTQPRARWEVGRWPH